MYIFWLYDVIETQILLKIIASIFNIDVKEIIPLQATRRENTLIFYEEHTYLRGYKLQMELYVSTSLIEQTKITEMELAKQVAARIGENVLISLQEEQAECYYNPYLWLLVEPSGDFGVVEEEPVDDEGIGALISGYWSIKIQ